jgi:deoxyinosine 3'endonuclease (endonuclease V)
METLKTYQLTHKNFIIKHDTFHINNIRYIGGLDISFDKKNTINACAYLTIFDLQTQQNIYEDYHLCHMTIPYIPGFLGFREVPEYKILLSKIKDKPFYPDVLMIDGFGILHHREFGSASHLGIELDIPTIGVAKTLLCIDGLNEHIIKQKFREKCENMGDYIELRGTSNRLWGLALKSGEKTQNPIYISIGHKISLETARKLVLQTCLFKNPEPIRNSDIKSKKIINVN